MASHATNDFPSASADSDLLLKSTTKIVSSFVGRHQLEHSQLSKLVKDTFATLQELISNAGQEDPGPPAVSIKQSVKPDYIVCLEDGKKLKMLKRHLKRYYGLSPVEYRKRWNLPPDYPMVAPNYAAKRSDIAKETGLGGSRSRRAAE